MFTFRCNSCGYTKSVESALSGRKARCPKCQAVNRVSSDEILEESGESFEESHDDSRPPSALWRVIKQTGRGASTAIVTIVGPFGKAMSAIAYHLSNPHTVTIKRQFVPLEVDRDDGTFVTEIVGESHYQQALETLSGGRTFSGVSVIREAILVLESDNPHDKHAVRLDIAGLTVGHLDRSDAKSFRRLKAKMGDTNSRFPCRALIVGGWDRGPDDRGHFGVRIDAIVRTRRAR